MPHPPRHSIDDWIVPAGHDDEDETAATVLMDDRVRTALIGEDARTPAALEERVEEEEALLEEPEGSLAGQVRAAASDDEDGVETTPLLVLSMLALTLVAAAIAIAPLLLL